jgi:hypothetical protein
MEETFKILKLSKSPQLDPQTQEEPKNVPCPIQKSYFIGSTSQGGIIEQHC